MKSNVRAAVAAMAIAHARGRSVSSVYDYKNSCHVNISANVSGNTINGYDYGSSCHFGGSFPGMYHYGTGKHIDLNITGGGKYSGYDYDTSSHFEVTVRGNNADIYDYGESAHFSYSA
ncbi:hypothetical protein SAMN02927900_01305 [Rhizobium mongolense subsp. loessense]|uniref:Uncharacterized protein n=1 Tax=Rhizobium mongolense subsp. loessense TaxID=158890 RepID=A0A1G4Q4V5_9HYPH|nr:hypothetical protein [Rhizobium mongolense]SCW39189.1 hypothetical protein SAMN02927900_01305 [Rhizobium mongolense subsp. loessense]